MIEYDWLNKKVLIVEDEFSNYQYFNTILITTNINIHWCKNGKDAVDIIVNGEYYDIILMDLKMPIMNGEEASKIIKEYNKNIPIIVLSANKYVDYTTIDCDDFLTKPFKKYDLFLLMNKYLKN